ncbi:MAG: hypothetical protein EOR72_20450 [Mesorhizobium sp.]|uniref:hypothetical protein n=1 Tax=Mesorhizobium sp. TaxID=1871066 RepID=UPI000FE983F0|nr:hypothetical protein [Mesorhizobium sp.]RWM12889.1 MAG: hypothetical protein EOR72_20450 [Mesorhizobium sp.]
MKKIIVVPVAVLAFLGAVAFANYWIAENPPDTEPIVSTGGERASSIPADLNTPTLLPLPELTQSLARPLFLKARRPWVAPPEPALQPVVAAVEPAAAPPVPVETVAELQLSLAGIQKDPDGMQALILTVGKRESRWVRLGETVDGWTVSAMDLTSVEFRTGEKTRTFELYPPSPSSTPQ